MKTFFKRLVLGTVLFLCSFCSRAFAFELFKFEIAPKYSILNGQMNELVFYQNGHKMSELNWELKNLNCLGFNASATWEFLTIDSSFTWGIPGKSGEMPDSDWLNSSNYSMKTNLSISDNIVDSYFDMDLKLLFNIKATSFLTVRPFIGLSYTRASFHSENAYGWYGNPTNSRPYWVAYNDPQATFYGVGQLSYIDYKIEDSHYNFGVRTTFYFLERCTASLTFGTAFFSQYTDTDIHHAFSSANEKFYLDKQNGYFTRYTLGTDIDVKIWKGLSAGTAFQYTWILETRGLLYMHSGSTSKYEIQKDKSGFSANYWNLDFFVKYSF